MRKGLRITGVCLVIMFFLGGVAYPAGHKARVAPKSKKTAKEYASSEKKTRVAKAAKKSKKAALKSSRLLVSSEEEPVSLKTSRSKKNTTVAGKKRASIVEEVAEAPADNDEYIEYRIQKGDTLEKLAQRFNIEKEEIIDLNRAAKKRLKPGTVFFIPKSQDEPEEEPIVLNDRPLKPWKNEEERGILVKVAKSFSGAPYQYGGDSVRGLDCSAFVRKMYEIFEVQLPRCAREQYYAGPRVDRNDLLVGDLVFFKTKRHAKYPTHVGIYIGEDKFIHASSLLKRGVKVDKLSDSYFSRTYTGAVRVKAPPATDNQAR